MIPPFIPAILPLLFWPAAVLFMAAGQGLLLPAVRRTPPGTEAKRQAFALHWLLTAAYFLPLALTPSLLQGGVALASRLLLFDVVLNVAAGDRPFAVGKTAASDRAMQWLAQRLGWPAERVRLVAWVVSLVAVSLLLVTHNA